MPSYTSFNQTRETTIASHIELADTAHARRVGLLEHEHLEMGHGILIPARKWIPFIAIHTIRMKFPIDILFLDKNNRVLSLFTLPPNRVAWAFGAWSVLETAEGAIAASGTQVGDDIVLTVN